MIETPYVLKEGRTCYFYVGQSGCMERIAANQERRDREALGFMAQQFENSVTDHEQDEMG